MNTQHLIGKKIGIWGLGVVGKSLTNFLINKKIELEVLEKRKFSREEKQFLQEHSINFFEGDERINSFLQRNDYIIASPGVDLRNYQYYKHKFIAELDLFAVNFSKPIIAVTGTVGKTTVVHLINELLKTKGICTAFGGNVGIGMCDLIQHQEKVDCAVLELSSFQLEHVNQFASQIAVWTNFFPNHLDRHNTMDEYFAAKYNILKYQQNAAHSLVPFVCAQQLHTYAPSHKRFAFFAVHQPTEKELSSIRSHDRLFFINEWSQICLWDDNQIKRLISTTEFPPITFIENWLIAYATLYLYGIQCQERDIANSSFVLPSHRLQKCATKYGIDFYDDSKSTVPQATQAAIAQLQGRPIILLLGGISKGIDRAPLIASLTGYVKAIICFGQEAEQLYVLCRATGTHAIVCKTLEEALTVALQLAQQGDQILLSPAGASFDLFANYQERGKRFRALVDAL